MQSQAPLYIQALSVEFCAMKTSMPYPGTPPWAQARSQFLISVGRKKWGGKGQFRYFQERSLSAAGAKATRRLGERKGARARQLGSRSGRAALWPLLSGAAPSRAAVAAARGGGAGTTSSLLPCLPARDRRCPPPARPRPHLRQRWAVAPPGPLAARPPAPWRRSAGVARWRPCRCRPRCARAWPSWSWSCRRVSGAGLRGRARPAGRPRMAAAGGRGAVPPRAPGVAAAASPPAAALGGPGLRSCRSPRPGAGIREPGAGGGAGLGRACAVPRHPRGCTARPRPLRPAPAAVVEAPQELFQMGSWCAAAYSGSTILF